MKQLSHATTRFKLEGEHGLLYEMEQAIMWMDLLAQMGPHASVGKTDRRPFPTEIMRYIRLRQQFFEHFELVVEEALHDNSMYREFAHLEAGISRLPDERTISPCNA